MSVNAALLDHERETPFIALSEWRVDIGDSGEAVTQCPACGSHDCDREYSRWDGYRWICNDCEAVSRWSES